jgi:hypothetical protein
MSVAVGPRESGSTKEHDMGLMKTLDAMDPLHQEVVKAMSDAAREAMRAYGFKPLNDDRAAIFDEACAVFLNERLREMGNKFAVAA